MGMDRAQKQKERDQFDLTLRGTVASSLGAGWKVAKGIRGYIYMRIQKELAATTKKMQSIYQSQSLGDSF